MPINNDNYPPLPGRPDHADFWRLAEIFRRLDDRADTGQEPFRDIVPTIIDRNVLRYAARQRALRCMPLLVFYGFERGTAEATLPVLASAWVDAAIMMAVFERERPRT